MITLKSLITITKNFIQVLFIVWPLTTLADNNQFSAWNNTSVKQRLISFINSVSDKNSHHYVDSEDRIAVFDNDGTLWPEKPAYFQLMFALERLKVIAKQQPKRIHSAAIQELLTGKKALSDLSHQEYKTLINLTHSGLSVEAFKQQVSLWANSSAHPELHCKLDQLAYLPMLELLNLLKKNHFKIYIVTGGGEDFVRALSKKMYGLTTESVIGSQMNKTVAEKDGQFQVIKNTGITRVNDKLVKVKSIAQVIGKRPIIAVGNSDGDLQMLNYTASHKPSLSILLWHTDALREFAYDKKSNEGRLDKALARAKKNHWLVVDMKKDWDTVFKNKQCKR